MPGRMEHRQGSYPDHSAAAAPLAHRMRSCRLGRKYEHLTANSTATQTPENLHNMIT